MKNPRNRLIPELSSPVDRFKFIMLNFILLFSGISLVGTFLYLLKNLEKADRIIFNCLPVFTLGIVLLIVYFFLHDKLVFRKRNFSEKTLSFRK
mgnify:CR=1 FL=1